MSKLPPALHTLSLHDALPICWQLARSFLIAQEALSQGADDSAFLHAKITTARFYADHILSKAPGVRDSIVEGADSVTEMALESF